MLYIYVDNCLDELPSDYESYVSDYFDDAFESSWFSDDFVRKIIKEIDDSEVVGLEGASVNIFNKVLGNIPPQYLSSGCKALILLYIEGIKVNGDRLGDNCMNLLLQIADMKDVYISLSHIPPFPNEFNAVIVNNGVSLTTFSEFVSWKIRLG